MDVVPALQFILARVGKGVNSHIVFVPCSGGGGSRGGAHERRERTAQKQRTQTELRRQRSERGKS